MIADIELLYIYYLAESPFPILAVLSLFLPQDHCSIGNLVSTINLIYLDSDSAIYNQIRTSPPLFLIIVEGISDGQGEGVRSCMTKGFL